MGKTIAEMFEEEWFHSVYIPMDCIKRAIERLESRIEALEKTKPEQLNMDNSTISDKQANVLYGLRMARDVVSQFPDDAVKIIDGLITDYSEPVPVNAREWIPKPNTDMEIWLATQFAGKWMVSKEDFSVVDKGDFWMPYHEGDTAPEAPEVK